MAKVIFLTNFLLAVFFIVVPNASATGCQSNAQCNDGNACTTDVCQSGQCVNNPIPDCVACGSIPADIVLMLDRTGSVSSTARANEATAAKNLVDALAASGTHHFVSIGRFGDNSNGGLEAEITLPLSDVVNNTATIKTAITNALSSSSSVGTNLKDAIDVSRVQVTSGSNANKVIVLISDGTPNEPTNPSTAASNAATTAKNLGIKIFTIAFDASACDSTDISARNLLASMATDSSNNTTCAPFNLNGENMDDDHFFVTPSTDDIQDVMEVLANDLVTDCDDEDHCTEDVCEENGVCSFTFLDMDLDGTCDPDDNCPTDPNKIEPGVCGCGTSDVDSDEDGTPDCNDECDNDPDKTEPGVCGCGTSDVDSDEDGTADCLDECDNDPDKVVPGICGCGTSDVDTDQDGTADCNDECDNDPDKVVPGQCGCGVADTDTDQDGTADCNDECDNDPSKVVPGICGCGVADTDTDNDGTADCNDECDNDPEKTEPGICGCGTSDVDTDEDGTADCNDECPNDPSKTVPGICGCGTSDVDTDEDGTADCNDQCPQDPGKTAPGVCGCSTPDRDLNENNIIDCLEECVGVCDPENPELDEDEDGITNCQEIEDETDPCDGGNVVDGLDPTACAGPNGFFDQINIATVNNIQQNSDLYALAVYRDLLGVIRGHVAFTLAPNAKLDIIVNDLGLTKDSYGTLCIVTDAKVKGAWSGGLTIYKVAKSSLGQSAGTLSKSSNFDYALYYPFTNAITGKSYVTLNTNAINGVGTLANWVRLSDAVEGDSVGLIGFVNYYGEKGELLATDPVFLPDGGRYDFSAHEKIGVANVGMAEFIPMNLDAKYYVESSRYHYQGSVIDGDDFFSAYAIPISPLTGAQVTSRITTKATQLTVAEIINGSAVDAATTFSVFDETGSNVLTDVFGIFGKGSLHRFAQEGVLTANSEGERIGTFSVSGPVESLSSATVIYTFDDVFSYLFAAAPPFSYSNGRTQFTEYNSFVGHLNKLVITNTKDFGMNGVEVTIYNIDGSVQKTFNVDVAARGTSSTVLTDVPEDSYGVIKVKAQFVGLVIANEVSQDGEYLLTFVGR